MSAPVFPLPDDLPVPEDDGACSHLTPGTVVPSVTLGATDGSQVDLSSLPGLTVVYCYPMTGVPGQALPPGWDMIPGARGCTPQSCAFRDHFKDLKSLGLRHLYGLSTQDTDYQKEFVERAHLPFQILSDGKLELIRALRLPTFQAPQVGELVKRVTLIIRDGRILQVFYPIFPSDRNAAMVIEWLTAQAKQ